MGKHFTTLNGYYIHDCRKAAKYAFGDFLICVKGNDQNHCYDIFVRQCITVNGSIKNLDQDELNKFRKFYPSTFNIVLLSEAHAEIMSQ